jgi:integrase
MEGKRTAGDLVGPKYVNSSDRPMVRAELLGAHSHPTAAGTRVHVWKRSDKFLARGSHPRDRFGVSLGSNERQASIELRSLLTKIDSGTFDRPSNTRKFPLPTSPPPRLSLRELANHFLTEKRSVRGKKTARTYQERLMPVLEFAEVSQSLRRWPLAEFIDREFALEVRPFLHRYQTTRNGRSNGTVRPLSGRQIFNVLDCTRSMFNWARRPEIRKLPNEWINPFTPDIVGHPPSKDPLRLNPLSLEDRINLINASDFWQLLHLGISLVLPLRPEEATGLLVSDVKFDKGWLEISSRFGGADYTKGHTSFKLPFPSELEPLLRTCIADREDGPLLRRRKVFDGRKQSQRVTKDEIERLFHERLAATSGKGVSCRQDRKLLFRELMIEIGGLAPDDLSTEFKKLRKNAGIPAGSLKTLREAATQDMAESGIRHLELRYLTSHSTNDILNMYTGLNPVGEMQKYFQQIRPLLNAVQQRSKCLGIVG